MFFLVLCLISFSCFSVARGELQAVCSSGMTVSENQTASPGVMKITGTLPYDRNLRRSCVLKMDTPKSCLHVKAKRNGNSQGFLNIFVYEAEGSSRLLGHVDVSPLKSAWNSQTICPPRSVKPRVSFLSVVGTGGVSFAVDLSQNPSEIMLDIPQTVNVKSTKAIVFPFNPPKDISGRQLDITVTSPSNIPAYLKVSQIRQDVDENIEVVDYKKASLRLSFAKKGRITLSKVSVPPLTASSSSWFIGIALKNATGSLKLRESKDVTLKLSQSFGYSYARPICTLFFVSLGLGIIVSGLAVYLFKESLVKVNIPEALDASNGDQDIRPNNGQDNSNNSQSNKRVGAKTKFGAFICAMMKVACSCWFSGGPKTYSYATGVAGFVLMVGACQFVIANWYIMIQEGDRDDCYYNDFCYRVSAYHDIPLNLMISNLTYIVHALILTLCVLYMETELYLFCESLQKSSEGETKPNHVFGLCPDITPHLQQGAVPKHTLGDKEKKKLMARALKRKYTAKELYLTCESLQGTEPSNGQENGNNVDNCQSTFSGCEDEALPNHVFLCPDITPHLQQGAVPKHTLGDKEKKKLMARALKKKYSYSIGYAFAWALLFEGLFSLLYHLCPSRYTFQFDSAFMFVIAGLTVLLVYNGMELSECPVYEAEQKPRKQHQVEANSKEEQPVARSVEQHPVEEVEAHSGKQHPAEAHPVEQHKGEANSKEEKPVARSVEQHPVEQLSIGALNFFLYFIVPLFIFNYLGTLYHSESGLVIALQVVFFIALVIWWFAMGLWAFHKLRRRKGVLPLGKCEGDPCEMRWNACYYFFGCVIFPPALFIPIFLLMDLSQVFLFTCIVESVWALSAKAKLLQKLFALLCLCKCPCKCTGWFSCICHCPNFFQGLYIFVTVGLLAAAFGVFQGLQTTDKTASPEDSRDLNKECVILGFFDWHDLWHFLSSFALLMGAFVIMFISAEPKNGKTARWNGTEMSEIAVRESAGAKESVAGKNMAAGT